MLIRIFSTSQFWFMVIIVFFLNRVFYTPLMLIVLLRTFVLYNSRLPTTSCAYFVLFFLTTMTGKIKYLTYAVDFFFFLKETLLPQKRFIHYHEPWSMYVFNLFVYCMESANRKYASFGSLALILSVISNWLSAHVDKNAIWSTFN